LFWPRQLSSYWPVISKQISPAFTPYDHGSLVFFCTFYL
jgi:hypothetical protein